MSPSEVLAYAEKEAAEDVRCHVQYNTDLNPFSTAGARYYWQQGFEGCDPPASGPGVSLCRIYQRGAAAARLVQANKEVSMTYPISIPQANNLTYNQNELDAARDFLDDNCILVSEATLAAAAFLLKEQY